MKKIDLAQTLGILANVGVIAGIVFLAVEIGQNNDQLAAQTRSTIYELRSGLERDLINNVGGIAELVARERRGEALTDVEESRLLSRRFNMLRTFEYMVRESPDSAGVQAGYMANMFKQGHSCVGCEPLKLVKAAESFDRGRIDKDEAGSFALDRLPRGCHFSAVREIRDL